MHSISMSHAIADEILNWRYEPPYDIYNNEKSEEAFKEFLGGSYQGVINDESTIIGFFCAGKAAQVPKGHEYHVYPDGYIDIGLGMKPALTGKGRGSEFLAFILEQTTLESGNKPFRLTVASFNERAIHLYGKFGFRQQQKFANGHIEFLTMVKETEKA
ncbi:GNAT family N-acetyltransferase [Falsibacillus pallidus]|uniref:RimJ/RimL family protein N-acetyltransferase n=1 Tax=Falsibacillus pallidus TaxID=493781 RepID=A0A370GW15_9BACI|nr:GNAT family N-acetyltransferase [Falsibacillus pallidus]RDI47842.1 RimJ/RimL family protein N-acetyltransferase [Falsibacillus pallidus]